MSLLVSLLAGIGLAQPSAAGAALDPGIASVGSIILSETWVDDRTLALTISTPSFASPTVVEVMLPVGYADDSRRRWPVTFYLAGTNHDETAFRAAYNGESLTGSFPSLVVAPRGDSGYWSDWYNDGASGPPRYETFVIRELIPLIDTNFRTIADRGSRAVMGESMGGYGAIMLAARHPDLFGAVASLSGAVDSNWPGGEAAISASPLLQGGQPDAIYGPRATQEVLWRGHNPVDLAENLSNLHLQIRTGNGVLDPSMGEQPGDTTGCSLEAGIIHPESVSLHNVLTALGVAHAWQDYPWGCHGVALFDQQIRDTLPGFEQVFAQGAITPTSFDYRSIEPTFNVWGWTVVADKARAVEFLDFHDVSTSGLTVTGSGRTLITTPPLFYGARRVDVLIDGRSTSIAPDKAGRISFTVDLGPADQQQQYTLGSTTTLTTRRVAFRG